MHFSSLMDLCRLKNAELAKHLQKYNGRVVLRETTARMKDTGQCSQKVRQRLRWQRQSSWTLCQSFLVGLDKQVTPFKAYTQVKMTEAPDCYECPKKSVL